jgi:hypothetical protein
MLRTPLEDRSMILRAREVAVDPLALQAFQRLARAA